MVLSAGPIVVDGTVETDEGPSEVVLRVEADIEADGRVSRWRRRARAFTLQTRGGPIRVVPDAGWCLDGLTGPVWVRGRWRLAAEVCMGDRLRVEGFLVREPSSTAGATYRDAAHCWTVRAVGCEPMRFVHEVAASARRARAAFHAAWATVLAAAVAFAAIESSGDVEPAGHVAVLLALGIAVTYLVTAARTRKWVEVAAVAGSAPTR